MRSATRPPGAVSTLFTVRAVQAAPERDQSRLGARTPTLHMSVCRLVVVLLICVAARATAHASGLSHEHAHAPKVSATGPPRGHPARPGRSLPALPTRHRFNWLNPTTWPWLPVPLTAVSPNSGTTIGVIPTRLVTNARGQIIEIIAPDIEHSPYFGWGAHARILAFPSADTHWSIVAGGQQHVESVFDALYQTGLLRTRTMSFSIDGSYDRNGTSRFYGVSNDSQQANQSVYTRQQFGVTATLGWNITRAWQLADTLAVKKLNITAGHLPAIPSTTKRFADAVGFGASHFILDRVALIYDTRNNITMPTRGMKIVLYGGVTSGRIERRGWDLTEAGGDDRFYWSPNHSLTIAAHLDLRYEPSAAHIPFWALSSIGGDQSVIGGSQILRGYATSRFYGRNAFVANLELRQNILYFNALSTHLILQIAPFFDTGRVFRDSGAWPIAHLHNVVGVGFRGMAPPFVVGYVDVGKGSEGIAVFTGIHYPF